MNPETVKCILGMLLDDMQVMLQVRDEFNRLPSDTLLWLQAMLREYVAVWKLGHDYIDPPVDSSNDIYRLIKSDEEESKKTV